MIRLQLVKIRLLGAHVDMIQVIDTLKHKDLQFIMNTTTGLYTIKHKISAIEKNCLNLTVLDI